MEPGYLIGDTKAGIPDAHSKDSTDDVFTAVYNNSIPDIEPCLDPH